MVANKNPLSLRLNLADGSANADFRDDVGSTDSVNAARFASASAARQAAASSAPTQQTTALAVTQQTAAPAPTQVTTAASAIVIDLDWDQSVANAPSGFMTDVIAAAHYLESQFSDAVTLTVDVGYDEVAGTSLGGALGESLTELTHVSYASLRGAVAADATTATDASVLASLPATSPVSGANFWVTTAQAKALGLTAANGAAVDGSVGFGTGSLFTYGDTATTGVVTPGTYDFFATVVHELTEVMGRQMLTGATEGGYAKSYSLLDLLHYSAAGVRDFTASTAGYFSVDGGITDLGAFNTASSGDSGDWATSVTDNPFDAFATSGVLESVTPDDLTEMDALGWNASGGPLGQSPTPPAGVLIYPAKSSLASAQVNKGLAANAPLATFVQTGGPAADTYVYGLDGAGAASFTVTGATLSVGASALMAGKSGAALYDLTVTATDVATGLSSPGVPINVVVGSNANDIIYLSSLPGISAAAPTFIYGLGGIDTIDGSGMTGALYFDSGTGADTFTGGLGSNIYEYGAAMDSTASAMDFITKFHTATDQIDLTGLGVAFGAVTSLGAATTIAAGSIGWQLSGGNTFVYVNTGNRSEALGASNMKIELQGSIALTPTNFVHL